MLRRAGLPGLCELILDVGCGSGRSTQLAFETDAEATAFDSSRAVEVPTATTKSGPTRICQSSISDISLRKALFSNLVDVDVNIAIPAAFEVKNAI